MKFDIEFQRSYAHPLDEVWQALTDPGALGEWLMETDFKPEAGRRFTMWCNDDEGGTDVYHCRLLEFEPPHRMLWSWLLDGWDASDETVVEIMAEAVADGTRVTIRHSGDRRTIENFKSGWPHKLDGLRAVLDKRRGGHWQRDAEA